MKTLMYLFVVAILVLAGCAKDDTLFENPDNLELKKAKVPIPMKADLYAVLDMDSEPILVVGLNPDDPNSYNPSRLIVSGTGTHFGKIDAKKSFYEFDRMEFTVENGIPFLINTGTGVLVGANGDGLKYAFRVQHSLLDGSSEGVAQIIPGSGIGKFEGCSGTIDIVGGWHQSGVGSWLKLQGYLVYK